MIAYNVPYEANMKNYNIDRTSGLAFDSAYVLTARG